jgi:hypothetical protein
VSAPARPSRGTQRLRRTHVEAAQDREWLQWISRFRFVTAAVLAQRFDVSVRQANARVARLAHDGLVVVHRDFVGQASAIYLARAGSVLLGQPPRRAPRPDTQREHELAIARLVADLERRSSSGAVRVLTERECRRQEGDGARGYSVELFTPGHPKRWPDLVLQSERRKDAIELELAPKTTDRLTTILTGYAHSDYTRVLLLVESPVLARRLGRVAAQVTATTTSRWRTPPVFHIDARPTQTPRSPQPCTRRSDVDTEGGAAASCCRPRCYPASPSSRSSGGNGAPPAPGSGSSRNASANRAASCGRGA